MMTLSTDVIIRQPVNAEALFMHLMGILATDPTAPSEPAWDHEPDRGQYLSRCGQGLAAWTGVFYAIDGPLRRYDAERIAEEHEYCPTWQVPEWNEHCVRVNFDTTYAYKGSSGARCGDLHAFLVTKVYEWCAERGVTDLWWEDESGGQYFQSLEALAVIGDPAIGGQW